MQLVLIGFAALIATEFVSYSNACNSITTTTTNCRGNLQSLSVPCGVLPPNQPSRQLIHAGNTAEEGQWPWLAMVTQDTGTLVNLCAGAIIHTEWILTAAHCLLSDKASDYCVVIGHNDVSNLDWVKCAPLGQRPIQVFRHPIYNQTALGGIHSSRYTNTQKQIKYHDIGLIKMAPISFDSPKVGAICLPPQARNYSDQFCHVAGWGLTESGSISDRLKTLRSQIWSESDCKKRSVYGVYNFVDNFYCFGEENDNVCKGDSGAPLFCERPNGEFEVVGVASMKGYRDCTKTGGIEDGWASYFVRVPTFLEWIQKTILANTELKMCLPHGE